MFIRSLAELRNRLNADLPDIGFGVLAGAILSDTGICVEINPRGYRLTIPSRGHAGTYTDVESLIVSIQLLTPAVPAPPEYFVDGNSHDQVEGFGVWKVVNATGQMYASFFGPMAASAAGTFCAALREHEHLSPVETLKFQKPRETA